MAEAPVQPRLLLLAVLFESSVMRYSVSFQTACRGRAWILQGLVRSEPSGDGRRAGSGVDAGVSVA
jgi:hypothetical protein